jgi:hypothetical protein
MGAAVPAMLAIGIILAGGIPAHAGGSITCSGSVACAGGSPSAEGCTADAVLIQDEQVPGLGEIDLYESDLCGTAWATLSISTDASVNSTTWPELAEIFYEPPEGGAEQFEVAVWGGDVQADTTTTMVPINGSVKACGGDPQGSADPFDEDPQGANFLSQNPSQEPLSGYLSSGACTLWH